MLLETAERVTDGQPTRSQPESGSGSATQPSQPRYFARGSCIRSVRSGQWPLCSVLLCFAVLCAIGSGAVVQNVTFNYQFNSSYALTTADVILQISVHPMLPDYGLIAVYNGDVVFFQAVSASATMLTHTLSLGAYTSGVQFNPVYPQYAAAIRDNNYAHVLSLTYAPNSIASSQSLKFDTSNTYLGNAVWNDLGTILVAPGTSCVAAFTFNQISGKLTYKSTYYDISIPDLKGAVFISSTNFVVVTWAQNTLYQFYIQANNQVALNFTSTLSGGTNLWQLSIFSAGVYLTADKVARSLIYFTENQTSQTFTPIQTMVVDSLLSSIVFTSEASRAYNRSCDSSKFYLGVDNYLYTMYLRNKLGKLRGG